MGMDGIDDGRTCAGARYEVSAEAVDLLDLPREVVEPLARACATVRRNAELREIADRWHYLIYHLPGPAPDYPHDWPQPETSACELGPMFPLVALISGIEHTLLKHRELGIPDEITRATLSDAGNWVRNYHARSGAWGFGELHWLRRHARSEIFRLGRLQFAPAAFEWPFSVYRSPNTGEIAALSAEKERQAGDRQPIIVPGSGTLEVHIPQGEKLSPEACERSYLWAREFFSRYFSSTQVAAFTCFSWLLDPALREILPEESNIVRFQSRYHILPHATDEKQTYDRVFGSSSIDLDAAPRETFLQRAVADYVRAGGRMRCTAGLIPLISEQ